jgi:hypothetical protein
VQDKEKYQLLISKDPASLKKILKIVKRWSDSTNHLVYMRESLCLSSNHW